MEYLPQYKDALRQDIQPSYRDALYHHGIKGMKWGVRRYQNPDGTRTAAGKKRYSLNPVKRYFEKKADARKAREEAKIAAMTPQQRKHYLTQKDIDRKRLSYMDDFEDTPAGKKHMKKMQSAWDKLVDNEDDSLEDELNKQYLDAEGKYFYDMGSYMVKRLTSEHGRSEVEAYANEQRFPKADTLEKRFGQELWNAHGA